MSSAWLVNHMKCGQPHVGPGGCDRCPGKAVDAELHVWRRLQAIVHLARYNPERRRIMPDADVPQLGSSALAARVSRSRIISGRRAPTEGNQ